MDVIQAIIIGLVQGLTEFLPVSSSAHLMFAQKILGVSDIGLAFDVLLHLGTVIAVVWFFRVDIYKLIIAWFSSLADIVNGSFIEELKKDVFKKLAWYVVLGTIPVGLVGFLFESKIDALFVGALYVPAFFLFVTGTILYISQRMNSGSINLSNIGPKEVLFMGLGQACALLPGLSRSGTTIAAGLVAGLDKEFAAKFSFILSIPAILGAALLKIPDLGASGSVEILPLIAGFIVAVVSGYFAIKWLLELIQKRSLDCFAYYCWIVGIAVFLVSVI